MGHYLIISHIRNKQNVFVLIKCIMLLITFKVNDGSKGLQKTHPNQVCLKISQLAFCPIDQLNLIFDTLAALTTIPPLKIFFEGLRCLTIFLNFLKSPFGSHKRSLKESVQLSDKLRLFNSKFYQEFDGVNIFCQKLTLFD